MISIPVQQRLPVPIMNAAHAAIKRRLSIPLRLINLHTDFSMLSPCAEVWEKRRALNFSVDPVLLHPGYLHGYNKTAQMLRYGALPPFPYFAFAAADMIRHSGWVTCKAAVRM